MRQVTALAKVLRSHRGRLVPHDVPLPEAQAVWDAYDEIERCAVAAKTLLARVEESRTWARAGDRSAAEYMARKAGSSVVRRATGWRRPSGSVGCRPPRRRCGGELSRAQAG